MDIDIFLNDWERVKDRVRARWDRFTDETMAQIAGSREALAAKVREYYQISMEEALNQVRELETQLAAEFHPDRAATLEREIMAAEERKEVQESLQQIEALKRDLKNLRADMRELLTHAGEGGKYKLEDAKMRLRQSMQQMEDRFRTQARDTYDNLREQGENVIENVRFRVTENPLQALGIAFVAGVIASLLIKRK